MRLLIFFLLLFTSCEKENPPTREGFYFDFTTSKEVAKTNQEIFLTYFGPETDSVSWDFGDGKTAEGDMVSHKYKNPGRYNILCQVKKNGELIKRIKYKYCTIIPKHYKKSQTFNPTAEPLHIKGEDIKPGTTIYLKAGTYHSLKISDLHGSSKNPIIISPIGGEVVLDNPDWDNTKGKSVSAIQLQRSSHIIFDGQGSGKQFGIIVKNSGDVVGGVDMGHGSSDVEFLGIQIQNANTGFVLKTDPRVENGKYTRDKFLMKNPIVHHCLVEWAETEGFYIGYNNNHNNNQDLPHSIYGGLIYRNVILETGWDGIQIANTNDQEIGFDIHDNMIYKSGHGETAGGAHCHGMSLNDGWKGRIWNNKIMNSPVAIQMSTNYLNNGYQLIYNNILISTSEKSGQAQIFMLEYGDDRGEGNLYIFHNLLYGKIGAFKLTTQKRFGFKKPGFEETSLYKGNFYIKNNIVVSDRSELEGSTLKMAGVHLDGKYSKPMPTQWTYESMFIESDSVQGDLLWPVGEDLKRIDDFDTTKININELPFTSIDYITDINGFISDKPYVGPWSNHSYK